MRFGDYELDLARYELRRAGRRVRVQPRVLDVLAHLIRNRERVVSKEELLESVWSGTTVSETALTQTVKEARRAVRDDGARQRVIQTVRGRGYRFVARVEIPEEQLDVRTASDPFVGREALLSLLGQELATTLGGHGRAVFLTGEPGIGKSRAASELASRGPRRRRPGPPRSLCRGTGGAGLLALDPGGAGAAPAGSGRSRSRGSQRVGPGASRGPDRAPAAAARRRAALLGRGKPASASTTRSPGS